MATDRSGRLHGYTYEAYLELEEFANVKHEFLDGEIYAMAGGSLAHAAMAVNISASLSQQLRSGPCVVYSSDLKVRVEATGLATCPDVTVICGPPRLDPRSRHVALNPTVVVEVTSDGTEAWDRGEKLEHYRQVASLREVVLVDHQTRSVTAVRRDEDDAWSTETVGPGGRLPLRSVAATLEVDEAYRSTDVPA